MTIEELAEKIVAIFGEYEGLGLSEAESIKKKVIDLLKKKDVRDV